MLLQGAAPRERGQSTGAFAVRLVAGPRRSTAVHGTALCSALIALEGSILLLLVLLSLFSLQHPRHNPLKNRDRGRDSRERGSSGPRASVYSDPRLLPVFALRVMPPWSLCCCCSREVQEDVVTHCVATRGVKQGKNTAEFERPG